MDWAPVVTFATSIAVALISSFAAVKLALRRFYSEKWWERKSAAYAAIIEAVHHVREHADTNLVFSMRGKDLPADGEAELDKALRAAMAELRKQRDIGSFVISERAVTALNGLFSELEASTKTQHWQEHLEMKLAAVEKWLPELRRIAQSDLRLA
jgi:hypothetical protein